MLKLKVAQWLIDSVAGSPPYQPQTRESERKTLSMMWATQSIRDFFEHREKYLIHTGMDNFLNGKLTDAKGFGGQLVELRALKGKLSGAWAEEQYQRKETSRLEKFKAETSR